MKYGETLRQRSIPEWCHYNIDYDDIKLLIKEHTTPGKGKAVAIPGQAEVIEAEFENKLYDIFADQHQRIDLFVKSKSGEIERRLTHLDNQVRQLQSRYPQALSGQIPPRRLERYGRLEEDILKAGEEIRSLSRFTGAQRVAFAKLLKKYKRWTGSDGLGLQFGKNVLDKPESFVNMDLGPLLDHYTDVLHDVRAPFHAVPKAGSKGATPNISDVESSGSRRSVAKAQAHRSPALTRLRHASRHGSEVDIDMTLAAAPVGKAGSRATYWVHHDQLLELHVLLLQHSCLFTPQRKTRTTPSTSPRATPPRRDSVARGLSGQEKEDEVSGILLDDLEKFARIQSSSAIGDWEGPSSVLLTRASGFVRLSSESEALIQVGLGTQETRRARVKQKQLADLLDLHKPFPHRKPAEPSHVTVNEAHQNAAGSIDAVRIWLAEHSTVEPLVRISSRRTRFVGLANNDSGGLWATLDTRISVRTGAANEDVASFPYAVLEVRKEGNYSEDLITTLDRSHLTERVRGFSIEAHAIWTCYKPKSMTAPYWLPILDTDIRKVPPPNRATRSRGSAVRLHSPQNEVSSNINSSCSDIGTEPSTPTGPAESSATSAWEHTESCPRSPKKGRKGRSRRKSSKRVSFQGNAAGATAAAAARYWCEYDHPEDGSDDAYVIYIDPNSETKFPGQETFKALVRSVQSLFQQRSYETEPLLSYQANPQDTDHHADDNTHDSSSSSDDENRPPRLNYGSLSQGPTRRPEQTSRQNGQHNSEYDIDHLVTTIEEQHLARERAKLMITLIALTAAISLVVVALVLAATGRKKQRGEVDAGIVIGVVFNLVLALFGIISMLKRTDSVTWLHRGLVFSVVVLICLIDGGLIAWMLN